MTLTTAPRGTFDLMPQQALVWQWMESENPGCIAFLWIRRDPHAHF